MLNYNIVGIPVKQLIFRTVLTATAGVGAGKCYRNLKDHPGTGNKILKYSIVGGVFGGLLGCTVGIFKGRGALIGAMTQTMYWSLGTAYFSNVRSLIKNSKLKLPGQDEPLKDIVVTSITSGIFTLSVFLFATSNPGILFSATSIGLTAGFLGHHIYEELRIFRLEFLLRMNYPELMLQKEQADMYIDDQLSTNPNYTGPVKERYRIIEYLTNIWFENKHKIEEAKKERGL